MQRCRVFHENQLPAHTLYVPCFPCHHFCGSRRRGRSLLPPSNMLDSPLEKKSHAHLWVHTTTSPALHVKNKSGEGESQSREKEEEEEERFTSRNQDNFFPFSTLVFSFSPPLRDFCLSSAEEEETYEKETGRRRLFALHSWLFFFSGSRACLVLVYCALSSLCEIWSLSSAGLASTSFLSRSESPCERQREDEGHSKKRLPPRQKCIREIKTQFEN